MRAKFIEALRLGREIEFQLGAHSYFASHDDGGWYLEDVQSQERQYFGNVDEFINDALLNGTSLEQCWGEIDIRYIL